MCKSGFEEFNNHIRKIKLLVLTKQRPFIYTETEADTDQMSHQPMNSIPIPPALLSALSITEHQDPLAYLQDEPTPVANPPPMIPSSSSSSSSSITTVSAKSKRTKSKRSKNGCSSCKRLKIKCTEEKPSCEYCAHTGRECVYLNRPTTVKLKVVKTDRRPSRPMITNDAMMRLNSMSSQLNVTSLESQLLKYYLEFGADFFTFKVDQKNYDFWGLEVPKLWCCSDLVKNALYSLSSARLLANYEDTSAKNVFVECGEDKQSAVTVNLFEELQGYMKTTNELMDIFELIIDEPIAEEIADMVGQLLVSKVIMTAATAMSPYEDEPIGHSDDDISHFGLFKMMESSREYQKLILTNFSILQSSKYVRMFSPNFGNSSNENRSFRFTEMLRDYVLRETEPLDILQISYLNFISRVAFNCHKAIGLNYPIALVGPIRESSTDEVLVASLKKADHISLKLVYYVCCIVTIFDFKLGRGCALWNEVIEFYKKQCFKLYDGRFEDEMDLNVYNVVLARRESKIPYDLSLIYNFGAPVEDFINGKIELLQNDCPPVFF